MWPAKPTLFSCWPFHSVKWSEIALLMPVHAEEVLYAEDHAKWSKNKRFSFVAVVKLQRHLFWRSSPITPDFPFPPDSLWIAAMQWIILSYKIHSVVWLMNALQCPRFCQLSMSESCLSFLLFFTISTEELQIYQVMRGMLAFGLWVVKHDQIKMLLESGDYNHDSCIADI